ncbi:MAG: hypothetical protein AAF351_02505 [Pseudomonadota bacterium]
MKIKTTAIAAIIILAAGCTTAGAPPPGERVEEALCTDGTIRVCTETLGGGMRTPERTNMDTCSCH